MIYNPWILFSNEVTKIFFLYEIRTTRKYKAQMQRAFGRQTLSKVFKKL